MGWRDADPAKLKSIADRAGQLDENDPDPAVVQGLLGEIVAEIGTDGVREALGHTD